MVSGDRDSPPPTLGPPPLPVYCGWLVLRGLLGGLLMMQIQAHIPGQCNSAPGNYIFNKFLKGFWREKCHCVP